MDVIKEFWAKAGPVTMPDGAAIPFWGFAPAPDGEPQLPGPAIEVKTGDNVRITLHNTLAEPVSMIFPGQDVTPEPVKDENNIFVSFDRHAPANGGTVTYFFKAARPGTYLYESGTYTEKQIQMGLYGVLVVRPADYNPSLPSARTAYGAGTGTAFDVEKIIATGEIDSLLHRDISAGLPFDTHNFNPDYFTINGLAYPDTLDPDDTSSQPYGAAVKTVIFNKVLLRCLNAGFLTHSLHAGAGFFRVVAGDGMPLKTPALDATYEKSTITIGPGQTYDLIYTPVSIGEIYLYDRELRCTVNTDRFPGGIMTRLEVAPGPPPAPGSLVATALSSKEVKLSWTDNSGGESSFHVERKTGAIGVFTVIATVPAGSTG
ncbi:MAG: multicopper oxidase domain-containing protein [Eubacteriales bacterium]